MAKVIGIFNLAFSLLKPLGIPADEIVLYPSRNRQMIEATKTFMRNTVLLIRAIRLLGPMVFCCGADALTISWGDLRSTVSNRPVAVEVEKATIR